MVRVRAKAKNIGVSKKKVDLLLDVVRGKRVEEALAILRLLASPTARAVAKVVKSAAANAENNLQLSPLELRIADIFAGQGRSLKRHRARSRGRASPILKRSSDITVIVEGQEV